MSSSAFDRSIVLEAPDRRGAGAQLGLLGAGIGAVVAASADPVARAAALCWATGCLLAMLRCERARGLRRAEWRPARGWLITVDGGQPEPARLTTGTRIHGGLVVLRFRTESGGRYRLPVPAASLSPSAHRRLRVRLLLGRD